MPGYRKVREPYAAAIQKVAIYPLQLSLAPIKPTAQPQRHFAWVSSGICNPRRPIRLNSKDDPWTAMWAFHNHLYDLLLSVFMRYAGPMPPTLNLSIIKQPTISRLYGKGVNLPGKLEEVGF